MKTSNTNLWARLSRIVALAVLVIVVCSCPLLAVFTITNPAQCKNYGINSPISGDGTTTGIEGFNLEVLDMSTPPSVLSSSSGSSTATTWAGTVPVPPGGNWPTAKLTFKVIPAISASVSQTITAGGFTPCP